MKFSHAGGVSLNRVPAPANVPAGTTKLRAIRGLGLALLFAMAISPHAPAQEDQSERRVISNTVEHVAPGTRPVFTGSRRSEQETAGNGSAETAAHPTAFTDDFDNSTPTPWWIETGQSPAQVSSTVGSNGARMIDIQVDADDPYSFTVTYVKNTGAYQKTWSWGYDLTAAQVTTELAKNNARPISLKAYDTGSGNIRFAVVMIANTGADQKASWWYSAQTQADLESLAKDNPSRKFIAIDSYSVAGVTNYSAIMVANTGADEVKWWWAADTASANIGTLVKNDSARVTYVSSAGAGKFNVVLEACGSTCPQWEWYVGQSFSQIQGAADQLGDRLVDLSSYPSSACAGTVCFAGATINNANAITTRVGNLIRSGLSGTEGLYLEEVSGPTPGVLANLEDGFAYEPASSIKALVNLYAMTKVQGGSIKLTTPVTHYTNAPESCPNPPMISGTEQLGTGLREMMWHSDNARTREMTDHFGEANITAYAHQIGMLNSGIYEIIGCGGPKLDTLTLDDAATMYAGVANQDLLNAENRGIFYSNMAGRAQYESEGYDWTAVWDTDIPNLIKEEAPAGMSATQQQAYMNAMNVAYKAGNYVFCQVNCPTPGTYPVIEDVSISGWFQLPICTASGTTYAEYVWGIFFANEPDSAYNISEPFSSTSSPTDHSFLANKSELMREQIAAGLASCNGKSLDVMAYSPADLVFAATNIGTTTASKSVTITNNQHTTVTGLSISIFGDFAETNNCGSSLASGASCTVTVTFTPTAALERTGAVVVTDDGNGQPQTIELTGTGN
jgi:hypothetical protein